MLLFQAREICGETPMGIYYCQHDCVCVGGIRSNEMARGNRIFQGKQIGT